MDTVRRLAWSVEHTVCKIFMKRAFVFAFDTFILCSPWCKILIS